MRWRVLLAVLVALAVGVAGGWFLAAQGDDDEAAAAPEPAEVTPVPADPTVPVEVLQPDPDDPPLEPGIALAPTTLRVPATGRAKVRIDLDVPAEWDESYNGTTMFYFTKPGNDSKSYGLRITVLALDTLLKPLDQSVSAAVQARLSGLGSAASQGNLKDLEYDLTPSQDGFEATYIDQQGYRRVSLERFYTGPDGNAFATVAAYGRVEDREGLDDLVNLVVGSMSGRRNDP